MPRKIEIYATATCAYCYRAKKLLHAKGLEFTAIDVTGNAELRAEMTRRSGGRTTVPQIFVDGRHIGDSDEMSALDARGELDGILGLGPILGPGPILGSDQ
jgi:glutaredoxin 3